MILIQNKDIRELNISPAECVEWVRFSFLHKPECQLPHKISLHPQATDFINTMPCILPPSIGRYCVKIVSRIEGRIPSLSSDCFLYDSRTGEFLAVINSDWITTMRTGAVAALAVDTFKKSNTEIISFIGLGNTARATMLCLTAVLCPNVQYKIRLLKYKDQAEKFAEQFSYVKNVTFEIVKSVEDLFEDSDVIVSCVTEAKELFYEDTRIYKPGVLIVPVHTKGFQNCDIVFDKVYCDDYAHVSGFKYYDQFKWKAEIGEVLRGEKTGRKDDNERILDYNIGLGIHDAFYCSKIYDMLDKNKCVQINIDHSQDKYII